MPTKMVTRPQIFDNGGVLKTTFASEAEAIAGTDQTKSMNAATTKAALLHYVEEVNDGGGLTVAMVNALIASKADVNFVTDFGVKNPTRQIDGQVVDVPTNGAVGTGFKLNVYYATLTDAKVDFPTAIDLEDRIDGLAVQNCIDFAAYDPASTSCNVIIPCKWLYFSRVVSVGYGIPFVDAEGHARDYVKLNIIGMGATRGKGNRSTEKGTVVFPLYNNDVAFNFQGNSKSTMRGITYVGNNKGIPLNGGQHGYNSTIIQNYVTSYNAGTGDGLPADFTFDKYRFAPPDCFVAIDRASSHPNTYGAPPEGTSSYAVYPDIVINPKYFASWLNDRPNPADRQWGKSVSTDIHFYSCDASLCLGFAVIQPTNEDGNGDFIRFTDCTCANAVFAVASCQSQARNNTWDGGAIDTVHTAFHCNLFGRRNGRWLGGQNTHVSVANLIYCANFSVNEVMRFVRYYGESFNGFGYGGYEIANTGEPVFDSCAFTLGHEESGFVPLNIYTGYSITFNNCKLYGRNIDFSCHKRPTFNKTAIEIHPAGAWNSVYNFDTDCVTNGYYYKCFSTHPISSGPALKVDTVGTNTIQVHIRKFDFDSNTFGSNAYKYPEFHDCTPGFVGRHGDYLYRSGKITVGNGYVSFAAGKLTFNVANIGAARQMVKDAIQPGGTVELTIDPNTPPFKFMVFSRSGTICEAVLLNGFIEGYSSYLYGDGTQGAMQALLSDTNKNWVFFNTNWYNIAPDGKNWAIKGTVTFDSYEITNIDWADEIENGSRGSAIDYLQANTLLHYHSYTFSPKVPTSEMETNVITGIAGGVATMKNKAKHTGTDLLYNKWPYEDYN